MRSCNSSKDGTTVSKLPSYSAMCKLIDGDSDVSMIMFKERQKKAAEDFGGIENEETSLSPSISLHIAEYDDSFDTSVPSFASASVSPNL